MATPREGATVPGTGAVGAIRDDAELRSVWLIIVACVAYLVIVGRSFNK